LPIIKVQEICDDILIRRQTIEVSNSAR